MGAGIDGIMGPILFSEPLKSDSDVISKGLLLNHGLYLRILTRIKIQYVCITEAVIVDAYIITLVKQPKCFTVCLRTFDQC